ncbi:hypothetical protein TNCV_2579141 [Trichonephila clavipes]|uniref:Uncharacterized protein n=1 Tax=Trichonephila clavipes TaxID=2585209 RepID=A0A8X6V7M2_TRICX|nr:hypothetical protein TNCV_2579141 [Trichonephila clavipes]
MTSRNHLDHFLIWTAVDKLEVNQSQAEESRMLLVTRNRSPGVSDVKDAARIGMPVVENIDNNTEIIEVDRHFSSRIKAQELNIDHKTI